MDKLFRIAKNSNSYDLKGGAGGGGGGGGGGVQAFHLGKNDFELGVGGDGQDTSRDLKVVLGPYV